MKDIGLNLLWAIFWGVAGVVVLALILGSFAYATHQTTVFAENGYCETILPGSNSGRWVKC